MLFPRNHYSSLVSTRHLRSDYLLLERSSVDIPTTSSHCEMTQIGQTAKSVDRETATYLDHGL